MSPLFHAPGAGETLAGLGHPRIVKVTPADTGGRYLQFESFTSPGEGAPLHWHRDEDEAFYVLAGRYEFRLGEQHIVATTGAFAFVPRGVVHGFTNQGHEVGRLLITVTPGTHHEALFRALDQATERDGAPLSGAALAALAADHGWVIVPQTRL